MEIQTDTLNRKTESMLHMNLTLSLFRSLSDTKEHIHKFQPPSQIFTEVFHHKYSLFVYLGEMTKASVSPHTQRSITRWYETTDKYRLSVI